MMFKIASIILVFAFVNYACGEFNLTVVHISDFHSHWFEFDENKHDCSREESKAGKCYGGFPRLLNFVRDIRKREKNVIVLSSGEFFLGRTLHAMHGWKPAHSLVPKLDLDAMSLSNHDFDSGIFELSAFLYAMKFPVLCANMVARNSTFMYSRVNKSAVIDVNGTKVGIVGYIHRHALKKSKNAASLKFVPEIPALKKEVSRLESEGVNKIIALGHAGYHTDLEIAKKVKGVDIVIGGDSDIMLFDPGHDADELSKIGNIHGNYPRVHEHEPDIEEDPKLANRTLVLHIPQHGMYVGVLRATFDDEGKIIHESGEPVLLDSSIPQDEETLEFLQYAKGALENIVEHSRLPVNEEILGKTTEQLDGNKRNCRMSECSLGNFIADAMLHEFTFHYRNKSEHRNNFEQWGPIDALVFNSGPILRSIEAGYITIQDILKSVCLGGFIRRVYMSGQQVLDMMEHSVKHYDPSGVTAPGAFLQVAGLKVEYDLSQPPGQRVRNLTIRCRDCGDDDTYLSVKPYKTYVIGMPNFVRTGRDGFHDFGEDDLTDIGQFDALLIVEYLRRMFEIEPKIDGRITFYRPDTQSNVTFEVPLLLFGEPASASNTLKNMLSVSLSEPVSGVSADSSTKNIDQENEIVNIKNYEKNESEFASVRENNVIEQYDSLNQVIVPEEIDINEDDYKNIESLGIKNIDLRNEFDDENTLNEENDTNKSKKENLPTVLSSKVKENSSDIPVPKVEIKTDSTSKIEESLKVLLGSDPESYPSTLENFLQNKPGLQDRSDLLGKIYRLKKDAVEEMKDINLKADDGNKTQSFVPENYIAVAENYMRGLFNYIFPTTDLNSVKSKTLSELENGTADIEADIEVAQNDVSDEFDVKPFLVKIVKDVYDEDIVKKLLNLTEIPAKMNDTVLKFFNN